MKLSEISATPQRMKLSQIQAKTATAEPSKPSIPAYGGKEGLRKLALGPVAYGSVPGSEDVLPMAGQMAGSVLGFPGSVAGATLGETARQGIRSFRGQSDIGPKELLNTALAGPSGTPKSIGVPTAITAGTEGFFRAVPRALFPKQFGGKARQLAGEKLGELAAQVEKNAPFANTAKNPFVDEIEQALKKNQFERGPAVQALANAKKKLIEMKTPLSFSQARQLEQQLGREAQFATDATQGHFTKAPKAPALNQAIKGLRAKVSGKVDEMAAQAGVPEFEKASRNFADLVKKFPEKDLQKMYSPTGMLIRGAIGGAGVIAPSMVGAGPLGAVAAPAILWANVPPKIKTAIFRRLIDTPIGRSLGEAATKGISEFIRKGTQS